MIPGLGRDPVEGAREGSAVRAQAPTLLEEVPHLPYRPDPNHETLAREAPPALRHLAAGEAPVVAGTLARLDERHVRGQRAHHEIAVVVDRRALVPPPRALEGVAGPEDRAGRVVPAAQPGAQRVLAGEPRGAGGGAADPSVPGAFEAEPRTDRDAERLPRERPGQRRERAGGHDVVGVEEHQGLSRGGQRPEIARARAAVRRLREDPHLFRRGRRRAERHVEASVGGVVVDHDDLARGPRLIEGGSDRLRQPGRGVVARNDHGHHGPPAHAASRARSTPLTAPGSTRRSFSSGWQSPSESAETSQ